MGGPASALEKRPLLPAIALAAAAMLAAASAGVAIYRSVGGSAGSTDEATLEPDTPAGDLASMIAALEARLRDDPDDAAGWRMLGWSWFETGELMRSASAYRRAAELEPDRAENWSSLGEALQTASSTVSVEAAAAFERALKLDPKDPRARYFLAVQKDLAGGHDAAVADWIALLGDTPAGAPWEADLRRTIVQVAQKHGIDLAGRLPRASGAKAAIPGPTPEQMTAAASIPPAEQDAMVRGMVDRLAARLEASPRDAVGWMRLMRARMVLGETAAARQAHVSALAAFAGEPSTVAELNRAAAELGVPGVR